MEVPEWVAQDPAKLNLVHAAIAEQCRVTGGFPYVLMRVMNWRWCRPPSGAILTRWCPGALIRQGLKPSISQKAQGKAWTGTGKRRYR